MNFLAISSSKKKCILSGLKKKNLYIFFPQISLALVVLASEHLTLVVSVLRIIKVDMQQVEAIAQWLCKKAVMPVAPKS